MHGWISLHRKIMDSAVWQDPELLRLWMYCLMKASHKGKEIMIGNNTVQLDPGAFVTGRNSLFDEYNRDLPPSKRISSATLWRWMKKLETLGNLNIESSNKFSVVTLVNYEFYQSDARRSDQQIEQEDEQQMISKRSANDQQMSTNNNVNKENNDNKVNKIQQGEENSENPFVMYQQYYGKFPSPLIVEDINSYLDNGMENKLVSYAIYKASRNGEKFNYARGILNRWIDKKIFTYQDALSEEEAFKQNKVKKINEVKPNEGSQSSYETDYSRYNF